MRLFSVLLMAVFLICLSGCGTPDYEVDRPDDFWNQENKDKLIDQIQTKYREKKLQWIIHVHFNGHDWGGYRDLETKVDFHEPGRSFPFARTSLSQDEGALNIVSEFNDRAVLLSLIYRYASARKANKAFRELFECKDGKSDLLSKTLVLGSGASHGAHELEYFGKNLKADCGKAVDFAIISDAIAQPGPFPLGSFEGLEEGGVCLQFYQTSFDQLIKGATVENCVNIRVRDAYHFGPGGMTRYPEGWMHMLLRSLDLSEPDFNLSAFFDQLPFLREELL